MTSTQWSVYNTDTKRIRYSSVPTSDITAEAVTVDGFAVSQKDFSGIVTTAARRYTAAGMELAHTDGRGNTTTTVTDIAGRSISVTDAEGNETSTAYCPCCDQPATVTDALGRSSGYTYAKDGTTLQTITTGYGADTFGYNTRSELTSAQVNNAAYAYDYDNIGNRKTAQENAEEITSCQSNHLNLYTMLSEDDLTDFIPEHERIATQKLELEWDFCGCGRKYELKLNGKI